MKEVERKDCHKRSYLWHTKMHLLYLRETKASYRWPLLRLELPDIASSRLAKGVPFVLANLSATFGFVEGFYYNSARRPNLCQSMKEGSCNLETPGHS